jgi:hypothetical protein
MVMRMTVLKGPLIAQKKKKKMVGSIISIQ